MFAGILTGKTVEDSGDAAKTGMELLEKYGYGLKDSLKAGALPGMAGGMGAHPGSRTCGLRRPCLA